MYYSSCWGVAKFKIRSAINTKDKDFKISRIKAPFSGEDSSSNHYLRVLLFKQLYKFRY